MTDKTSLKAVLLTLAIGLAAVPVVANAKGGHDRGQGQRASFEQLDLNSDGQITQAELQAQRAARFAAIDTDGDGFVSSEEIAAHADARRAKRAERMISRMDANGDGKLSAEEMAPPEDRMAKRMERIDTNDDGSISKEEFDAASKGRGGRHRGRN
jgi:Ca2+-binding EF-hand superfamily protein